MIKYIVLDEDGFEWDSFDTLEEALNCIDEDSNGREFSWISSDQRLN